MKIAAQSFNPANPGQIYATDHNIIFTNTPSWISRRSAWSRPLPLSLMITVISGTARNDSNTLRVAGLYHRLLCELGESDVNILSLQGINVWDRGDELKKIEQDMLIPTQRFVFIMPEYNGSFPGILKTMIDNSDIKACWWNKKALLTGLADGRAGNFRGLEHMTGILQYLHMNVYWDKLPISRINEEIDAQGNLLKSVTAGQIQAQLAGWLGE